jgi:flagellar hook-associated protein 1 FlgK
MLGLFGALSLGERSLQVQRQGVEVVGHNLANVNQAGYTRQRLVVQTSPTITTLQGQQGTGADAVAIQQLRNGLLDRQMQAETSVRGSLEAQQRALQYAQANLGQQLDRTAAELENTAATSGLDGKGGLTEGLIGFFNSFQNLATQPASSEARQTVLFQAQNLASQFNRLDQRLDHLQASLNDSVRSDVASANQLLTEIARLSDQIFNAEIRFPGAANDLRDARQQKLEALAKLVKIDVAEESNGMISLSAAGASLITGNQVVDRLEAYDAGSDRIGVRTQTGGVPLTLTGGSLHGTIEARDGGVAELQRRLNTLAATLITEVNALHAGGYSLTGSTGAAFFVGTNAGTIDVNGALLNNPALIQASGVAGARSDNQVALALAQLRDQTLASLGNETLNQNFNQIVAALGNSLASVNNQLSDQQVVEDLLQRQRDSISGVSLDEEMADLVKFQRAFEASARLISTIDEMLETVVNLAG